MKSIFRSTVLSYCPHIFAVSSFAKEKAYRCETTTMLNVTVLEHHTSGVHNWDCSLYSQIGLSSSQPSLHHLDLTNIHGTPANFGTLSKAVPPHLVIVHLVFFPRGVELSFIPINFHSVIFSQVLESNAIFLNLFLSSNVLAFLPSFVFIHKFDKYSVHPLIQSIN